MAAAEQPDDGSIPDSDRLFRRVPRNQLRPLDDGSFRPSSAVFKHRELSITIESLLLAQKREPLDVLKDYPDQFLTSILAGDVRKFGLAIIKDTDSPHDPAHGLVLGKKTEGFANAMVRSHRWVVSPNDMQPDSN